MNFLRARRRSLCNGSYSVVNPLWRSEFPGIIIRFRIASGVLLLKQSKGGGTGGRVLSGGKFRRGSRVRPGDRGPGHDAYLVPGLVTALYLFRYSETVLCGIHLNNKTTFRHCSRLLALLRGRQHAGRTNYEIAGADGSAERARCTRTTATACTKYYLLSVPHVHVGIENGSPREAKSLERKAVQLLKIETRLSHKNFPHFLVKIQLLFW